MTSKYAWEYIGTLPENIIDEAEDQHEITSIILAAEDWGIDPRQHLITFNAITGAVFRAPLPDDWKGQYVGQLSVTELREIENASNPFAGGISSKSMKKTYRTLYRKFNVPAEYVMFSNTSTLSLWKASWQDREDD